MKIKYIVNVNLLKCYSLRHVLLLVTPWSVACQAPFSMGSLLCPWDSPGKNTGVGCHFLFRGIFPTQRLNPGLLYCRQTLYLLSHQRRDRLPTPVFLSFSCGSAGISLQCRETWVRSLGWEDPLKKGMVTHSSILAWRIPWTE